LRNKERNVFQIALGKNYTLQKPSASLAGATSFISSPGYEIGSTALNFEFCLKREESWENVLREILYLWRGMLFWGRGIASLNFVLVDLWGISSTSLGKMSFNKS
jgi:hypothetical protein